MKNFVKRIAFVCIPHFFIEAEKLRHEWNENALCIIASGVDKNSMIIDFTESLHKMHIRRGILLKSIRHIKNVNVITIDYDYLKEINNSIIEYLEKYSIIVESNHLGEFYIELTGTEKLFGRAIDTCLRIILDLNEKYGFKSKIGIGSNKLISYIAAKISGNNAVYEIYKSTEDAFLMPVNITHIPDIKPEIKAELFSSYNIRTIRDLQTFTEYDLQALFRRDGDLLYSYSRNIAQDFLSAKEKEKVIGKTLILSDIANDDSIIRRRFFHLVLDLCADMRKQNIFPFYFDLQIIYKDNFQYVKSKKINLPTFVDKLLYSELLPYLDTALYRRTCINKIILIFSKFIPAAIQTSLFDQDNKDLKLCQAYDIIRDKFGKRAIYFLE